VNKGFYEYVQYVTLSRQRKYILYRYVYKKETYLLILLISAVDVIARALVLSLALLQVLLLQLEPTLNDVDTLLDPLTGCVDALIPYVLRLCVSEGL